MESHSIRINSGDAKIHCEIYGNKSNPVLVFLHGNGEELHYFDPQIEYFSPHYYIIAVDSRGHGKSSFGNSPLDFNIMSTDVINVLDALTISKAHIIGFSDGGNLALHLALLDPERVSSMILVGANYSPAGIRFIDRTLTVLKYGWLKMMSLFSQNIKKQAQIWNLMVHHPKLTINDISNIKIPTLILTGEKDMVTQRQNDEMSEAIKGSKRIIMTGANHFLTSNRTEEFNVIAESFLIRYSK